MLICMILFQMAKAQQLNNLIKKTLYNDYKGMFRPAAGVLRYPFITPGGDQYANDLWDGDSWLTNIALRQILTDKANPKEKKEAQAHERGCIGKDILKKGALHE